METLDIVKQWLKANDYDGLCNPDAECGCLLNDLAPCCGCFCECEAGYKVKSHDASCNYFVVTNADDYYALHPELQDNED